jgi:hypothetical protein
MRIILAWPHCWSGRYAESVKAVVPITKAAICTINEAYSFLFDENPLLHRLFTVLGCVELLWLLFSGSRNEARRLQAGKEQGF